MPIPENKFRNVYACPCGAHWADESEGTNDDRCPVCDTACTPTESTVL